MYRQAARWKAGVMRSFRKRPPVPKLVRRVPRPWDPPETEFPVPVPISTLQFDRSEQTAIAITGVWAYLKFRSYAAAAAQARA
jgi:hypothetical protein